MQTYMHIFLKMQNMHWNKVAKRGSNAFSTFSAYAMKMYPKVTGNLDLLGAWKRQSFVFAVVRNDSYK